MVNVARRKNPPPELLENSKKPVVLGKGALKQKPALKQEARTQAEARTLVRAD